MNCHEYLHHEFKSSGMRDEGTYFEILRCIAINAGKTITPTIIAAKFKETFKHEVNISHNTVIRYFKAIKNAGLIVNVKRFYLRDNVVPIQNTNPYIRDCKLFDYLVQPSYIGFSFEDKCSNPEDEYYIAKGKTTLINALLDNGFCSEDISSGRIDFFVNTVAEKKRMKIIVDFMFEKNNNKYGVVFLTRELKDSISSDKKLLNEYFRALQLRAKDRTIVFVDVFEPQVDMLLREDMPLFGLNLAIDYLLS